MILNVSPTWRFLELDHLFICELRAVVYHHVGVVGVTVGTERGFCDAATFYLHSHGVLAHGALEERLAHLWYQRGGSDDHALNGDQLVNI